MDLFSEDMRRHPYPAYDRLRSASPVFHLPPFDLWMLLDFEGVRRALVGHGAFSSDLSHMPGHGNPGEWFLFFDPPRHTKLRALISRAFTPRVVAGLEPRIRELSRQLLDQVIERGAMDLAQDYAVPLPMAVIAELLGVPAADWPRYRRWSDVILKLANTFSRDEEAARTLHGTSRPDGTPGCAAAAHPTRTSSPTPGTSSRSSRWPCRSKSTGTSRPLARSTLGASSRPSPRTARLTLSRASSSPSATSSRVPT
jgi:cytochrome P450